MSMQAKLVQDTVSPRFMKFKLHEEEVVGKLASVFIRHEDPDTGNVTEVSQDFLQTNFKALLKKPLPHFNLLPLSRRFAEILRGSYWAQQGSLNTVEQTLEGILPPLHHAQSSKMNS